VSDKQYYYSGYVNALDAEELGKADKKTQIDIMREWFLNNYENPAENTPYESAEGGYIYIWGGPYDADEVLNEEFLGIIEEETINELVKELENDSFEWAPIPRGDSFDDYYSLAVSSNTSYHETFYRTIDDISALLDKCDDPGLIQIYYKMLHVQIITALETYLSDAFINTVMDNKVLIRKFVETNPDFQKKKLKLVDIFSRIEKIDDEIMEYLLKTLWHNLAKVKNMYKDTLDIIFTFDISNIARAIAFRHDVVHRGGKDKDGNVRTIIDIELIALMKEVKELIDSIDSQLKKSTYYYEKTEPDVIY